MKTKRIAVLAYRGCMGMSVFGLCDTLLLANRVARGMGGAFDLFETHIVSPSGRAVTAAGGFRIGASRPPHNIDLLIVPGLDLANREGFEAALTALTREVAYLKKVFARGTAVASVCVGAFLLGEAGILDGRRVTTAWLFGSDLARRFPAARVQETELLIEDGGVTTTGAFSAAFDLAMHLITQVAGAKIANATARIALLNAPRTSQAAFVDSRMVDKSNGNFSASVQQWLQHRLSQPYHLDKLSKAFHVSSRTLLRRFKAETGMSPLTYLQSARIDKAKELLESSALSVAAVTERVGYVDVSTFCSLFSRVVKLSPAEYRARFRGSGT